MKLCTFAPSFDSPTTKLGLLLEEPNRVVDVSATAATVNTMSLQALLEGDAADWSALRELAAQPDESTVVTLDDGQWRAPLPCPASLRDCLSFEQHWIQCAQTVANSKVPMLGNLDQLLQRTTGRSLLAPPRIWRQRPIYYKGNRRSVVGHGATIRWPRYSKQLDFELEIAVYIGKAGVDIPVEEASQYVAGYSLFNDFSARDVQFREMSARLGPSKSKDFDTGNSLGPYLTTPDEVDLGSMTLEVAVNGDLWSRTDASSLYHSVDETISFLSQSEMLHPGDVIGLGTAPSGCGLELDRWIRPGDVVELRSNQLGVLRNQVLGS